MVRETWVQSQVVSYQRLVLNTSLLNTQQYKVPIKGKVEQSRERSSALLQRYSQHILQPHPSWLERENESERKREKGGVETTG